MEAREYQTLFELETSYWWFRAMRRQLLEVCRQLKLGPASRLLDVGCGTGMNVEYLRKTVSRATYGVDLSQVAVEYWRRRGLDRMGVGSVNALPFRDGAFNAVIGVDLLECEAVDESQALTEFFRVLRPGGHLILVVPAYAWLRSPQHHRAVHAWRRYTRQQLRQLLGGLPGRVVRMGHLFASLFGPIAVYRIWQRLKDAMHDGGAPRSELRPLPRALNEWLYRLLEWERRLAGVGSLPFGSSILMVVQKTTHHQSERSWDVIGGPGSWTYRIFDAMRDWLNRRLVTHLRQQVQLTAESRVLEGGSGPASGSRWLAMAEPVKLSVALDLDPEALQEARRNDPTLPAVVGDLRHLPFQDGAFDLVWNSSTLEHLATPEDAVCEMRRVTRPGGSVFVGVPYRFGPLGFQPWIRDSSFGQWLGPVFDRATLDRLLREQGLTPDSTMTYGCRCFIGILARKPLDRVPVEAVWREQDAPGVRVGVD